MTTAIVIEDEKPAAQYLISTLREIEPDIQIKATLTNIEQSIEYLAANGEADLIFSDVQLPDGLSFSIFEQLNINLPIIFITGYDTFMMNAFECNGIDYLLKPVCREDLEKALKKYKKLESHFTPAPQSLDNLLHYLNGHRRRRLVVKKGIEHIALPLDEVALLYTENKIVYVLDRNGRKYLADKNLSDLEAELDGKSFFRANRQYIVNIDYIKGFKPYERVKLQVDLTLPDTSHCIIISQETAPQFRKWIYEA
ncbi:MAG TPA: LytTR family DNA-binding domain-containing protein [Chitinophagaceae bacterium]|jgi:DNA-binding LytR/AlgR family response regulator|nr:LytTR family DNA-binding domain-containing protein [Chitinophagaceae bacterium]